MDNITFELKQEPYETRNFFTIRVKMVEKIIERFNLEPQYANVLASAIILKIKTGQIFTYDIETSIKSIFPIISNLL
jgi:hypothetical protein